MKVVKELQSKKHFVLLVIFLASVQANCQDMKITTISDFGFIEIGFRSSALVKIQNVGSSGLTISAAAPTATAGPGSQWECDCVVPLGISPGGEAYFKITFAPNAPGDATAELSLTSDDPIPPGNPSFSGTGIASATINSILVIDRSTSMSGEAYRWIDYSGPTPVIKITSKIESARSGGQSYYDLVKSRPGDKFGVVKFNDNADEPVVLGSPTSSVPLVLDGSLPNPATMDPSRLRPQNGTEIGRGLRKAFQRFPVTSPLSQNNVAILISDGIESRRNYYGPPWRYWYGWSSAMDVIGELRDDGCGSSSNCFYNKNIRVYSVAIGRDADQQMLRQISLASGVQDGYGYYYVDSESSGNSINGFFYKIWAHAKGYATVRDPVINVNLKGDKPIEIQSVSLTSSDIAASLFVADDSTYRQYYTLELRNPRGEVFKGSTKEKADQSSEFTSSNSTIYHLSRQKDNDDSFEGTWKLYLIPNGKCESTPASKENRGPSCTVPITFAAAAKSNLRLEASVLTSKNEPGAEISLMAQATEENLPLENATIMVSVKSPDGKMTGPIVLSNKGEGQNKTGDKVFKEKFYNTAAQGTYQVTFNATIKNNKGEITTREEIRFLPLFFHATSGNYSEVGGESSNLISLGWIALSVILLFIGAAAWLGYMKGKRSNVNPG